MDLHTQIFNRRKKACDQIERSGHRAERDAGQSQRIRRKEHDKRDSQRTHQLDDGGIKRIEEVDPLRRVKILLQILAVQILHKALFSALFDHVCIFKRFQKTVAESACGRSPPHLRAQHPFLNGTRKQEHRPDQRQHQYAKPRAEQPHRPGDPHNFQAVDGHAHNAVCKQVIDRINVVCKARYDRPCVVCRKICRTHAVQLFHHGNAHPACDLLPKDNQQTLLQKIRRSGQNQHTEINVRQHPQPIAAARCETAVHNEAQKLRRNQAQPR